MVNYHLLSTTVTLQPTKGSNVSAKAFNRCFFVVCYGFSAFN